jgi:hypothetical protein
MSATGRGSERVHLDGYPTPGWCVRRLLEAVHLPAGRWLDPCAGDGEIIRAARNHEPHKPVQWTAVEIHSSAKRIAALDRVVGEARIFADFLRWDPRLTAPFDVCLSNPPYSLAEEFIEHSLQLAEQVVFLLRVNFLSSEGRAERMRIWKPDVFILPNRPSFVVPHGKRKGATDSTEYAWFRFRANPRLRVGMVRILASTTREERRDG